MALCAASCSDVHTVVSVCLSRTAAGKLHSRSLTPDDDVFQYLASSYASKNVNMKKGDQCKNKMNFPNGITNGYAWYPLKGECLPISTSSCCLHQGYQLAVVSVLGSMRSLPSLEQWGVMVVREMLRHVPHCQGRPHSLRCLFRFFYDGSGMVPRKMNGSQLFTPSLTGKSDMQLKHCNGSIIKIKMELGKGTVYWGVKPKHNRKW